MSMNRAVTRASAPVSVMIPAMGVFDGALALSPAA